MSDKYEIQESLYDFPYHYLAYLESNTPHIKRTLHWGFEYLTYMGVVMHEIQKLKHLNILDIGCGDGYLLNHLNTEAEKFGVDLSEKAISFAKAFSTDARFEVEDIFNIKKTYDLVSLIEVLEHIPDNFIEKFMIQVIELIKKDGYFIISVPTTVIPLSKKHYRHYDENLLSEQIEMYGNMELVKEIRAYKESGLFKFGSSLLNNRLWSINSNVILKMFWNWHKRNNYFGDKSNGFHIVRIYKKK